VIGEKAMTCDQTRSGGASTSIALRTSCRTCPVADDGWSIDATGMASTAKKAGGRSWLQRRAISVPMRAPSNATATRIGLAIRMQTVPSLPSRMVKTADVSSIIAVTCSVSVNLASYRRL